MANKSKLIDTIKMTEAFALEGKWHHGCQKDLAQVRLSIAATICMLEVAIGDVRSYPQNAEKIIHEAIATLNGRTEYLNPNQQEVA